jgi:hypothetical protein
MPSDFRAKPSLMDQSILMSFLAEGPQHYCSTGIMPRLCS